MPVDSAKKADNIKLFTGTTQPPVPLAGISNDQYRIDQRQSQSFT